MSKKISNLWSTGKSSALGCDKKNKAMTSPISGKKTLGAELVLLSVAFIWGTTFTIVKEALSEVQVFVFLGQRFLLAFFGAGLILLGMLLAEVPQVFRLFFSLSKNRS